MVCRSLSHCHRTTKTRLYQESHCASNSERSWSSGQTPQNSLLGKELCLTLVRNTQEADNATEKHLDNDRAQDLVATEA